MSRIACIALASIGVAFLWTGEAEAKEDSCPVAGRYWVAGRMPNADAIYRGRVTISRRGNGCRVKWDKPNESSGTGTFQNGTLRVNFRFPRGTTGVVTYTLAGDGQLHGVWWFDSSPDYRGEETLSPHGPPQLGTPRTDLAPPPVVYSPPPPPPPPSPVAGDSWIRVEDDDRHSLYMRSLGASAENSSWHLIELWVEYDSGLTVQDFTAYSLVNRVVIDCSGRRFRDEGDGLAYIGRNRSGQGYTWQRAIAWEPYQPDQHRWFRMTCGL